MAIRITKSRGGTSIRATGADAQALFNAIAGSVLDDATKPNVRTCRVCGCTDMHACEGGCSWANANTCSRCVGKETQP